MGKMQAPIRTERAGKQRFFPEPDQPAEVIRKRLNDPAFVQSLAEAVIKIQMIIMPGHRIIHRTKILIY